MKRMHVAAAALGAAMLVGVTACGGSDDSSSDVSSDAEAGAGGAKVSITSPAANAAIDTAFTVKVTASEDLGAEDTGKHHVHLWFDDREDQYEIVESSTWKVPEDSPAVEGLEAGEHTMHVSLRNADHSAAGAENETKVMLGEAGGEAPPDDNGSGGGSSGGYDY